MSCHRPAARRTQGTVEGKRHRLIDNRLREVDTAADDDVDNNRNDDGDSGDNDDDNDDGSGGGGDKDNGSNTQTTIN